MRRTESIPTEPIGTNQGPNHLSSATLYSASPIILIYHKIYSFTDYRPPGLSRCARPCIIQYSVVGVVGMRPKCARKILTRVDSNNRRNKEASGHLSLSDGENSVRGQPCTLRNRSCTACSSRPSVVRQPLPRWDARVFLLLVILTP